MQYVKAPADSYRSVVLSALTIAAAVLIAGAALTLPSGQAEASPNKVTASKPCGSCHPPNKPPTRRWKKGQLPPAADVPSLWLRTTMCAQGTRCSATLINAESGRFEI